MRNFRGGRDPGIDLELQPAVEFRKTYGRLLKYAKPYTFWILIILIASLVSAFMSVLPAQVMGVAVDKIFEGAERTEAELERPGGARNDRNSRRSAAPLSSQ